LLDHTERDKLLTTAIGMRDVTVALEFSSAQNKLIILDCCHAGAVTRDGFRSGLNERVEDIGIAPDNHLALVASDHLEKARELEEIGGGFLTASLCGALEDEFDFADRDGDGQLSINDLSVWLRDRAAAHNRRNPELAVPIPYVSGRQRGADFVFNSVPKLRPATLPSDIREAIDREYDVEKRLAAVTRLEVLVTDKDPRMVLAALEALEVLTSGDSQLVQIAANNVLKQYSQAQEELTEQAVTVNLELRPKELILYPGQTASASLIASSGSSDEINLRLVQEGLTQDWVEPLEHQATVSSRSNATVRFQIQVPPQMPSQQLFPWKIRAFIGAESTEVAATEANLNVLPDQPFGIDLQKPATSEPDQISYLVTLRNNTSAEDTYSLSQRTNNGRVRLEYDQASVRVGPFDSGSLAFTAVAKSSALGGAGQLDFVVRVRSETTGFIQSAAASVVSAQSQFSYHQIPMWLWVGGGATALLSLGCCCIAVAASGG